MAANSDVFLQNSEIRVDEKAGSVTVAIVRTGSTADPVTIQYGVDDYSATEGEDGHAPESAAQPGG